MKACLIFFWQVSQINFFDQQSIVDEELPINCYTTTFATGTSVSE
jgi:TRAP-type C4-dicarboxylate transport system permease small subunit